MDCPICKKEFDEKTGRRPKKFCSDACKVKFWNKFKKMQSGAETKPPEYKEQTNYTHKAAIVVPIDGDKYETKEIDLTPIREQIEQLKKELYNCPKEYSETGRIIWRKEREKKIQSLQQQLKL